MNSRKCDVETFGLEPGIGSRTACALLRSTHDLLDFSLKLVDARTHLALGWTRRSLQPQIIDLGEDAVLAGHPAVAKFFPGVLRGNSISFLTSSVQQLADGFIEGRCRVIIEFRNAVYQSIRSSLSHQLI